MASYNLFNYNYRPAKAIERKIFVELLKELYGVSNKNLTYIGLGSIFFSDFKLMHKELGITKLINIEQNKSDEERFRYNKPYSCIELMWGMSNEVLPNIDWQGKKVVWLDYDKTLQTYMFEDIETIFTVLEPDSFYFITCNSSMHRFFDKKNNVHDETRFKSEFGNYSPYDLTAEMLTSSKSSFLLRRMFNANIKHILDQRNSAIQSEKDHLIYCQLLFIIYQDGSPMFSTGGVLKRKEDLKKFVRNKVFTMPYIRANSELLDLEMPILTNSEIDLINSHLPGKKNSFLRAEEIKFVPKEDREKYFNLYRFYPSFVEVRDF